MGRMTPGSPKHQHWKHLTVNLDSNILVVPTSASMGLPRNVGTDTPQCPDGNQVLLIAAMADIEFPCVARWLSRSRNLCLAYTDPMIGGEASDPLALSEISLRRGANWPSRAASARALTILF